MPEVGAPRSFVKKFAYSVEIDGVAHAGFNKFSEPKASFDKIEWREGGSLIPSKSPGLMNFDDVTLERGAVSLDNDLYDWFRQTGNAALGIATNAGDARGLGANDNGYKRNLDVIQRDRDGTILHRWRFFNAWIVEYMPGDWDNDSSEVSVEKVVLTYDYFEKTTGS